MIQRMANPATSKLKVQPDIIYMNMSTLICWYMRNCVSSPVSLCNDDRRWYFGFKRTRSSNDECSTGSNNYLRSTDLFKSYTIDFNRPKSLDVLDISLELAPYRKAGPYWLRGVSQSVIGGH